MTTAIKPLIVKTEDGKHTYAWIVGAVLRKQVTMSNQLNSPPSWTLAKRFIISGKFVKLDELPRYGIRVIQMDVIDAPCDANLYVASLNSFNENGLDVNRGTGPHRALALDFWRVTRTYKL